MAKVTDYYLKKKYFRDILLFVHKKLSFSNYGDKQ